jgi:hypothetical protein
MPARSTHHLLAALSLAGFTQAADWQPLFNGHDLNGWSGDPKIWRVEDGSIVGETDAADRKVAANTFLIWEGGEPGDFVLEYKARVTGKNNSGVQYRSRRPDPKGWVLKGYQMDLHPAKNYLGMLYEEGGRGIACQRGQKVTLADKPTVTGGLPVDDVALDQWNEFRIEARGNVLRHFVNGKQSVEITDVQEQKRAMKGLVGLQVHAGPPMKVEFKDLRWKPLAGEADTTALPVEGNGAKKNAPDGAGAGFKLAPGFQLEKIHRFPKERGFWVAVTKRDDGGFYRADQHSAIYRVFPRSDRRPPSGLSRPRLNWLVCKDCSGTRAHCG